MDDLLPDTTRAVTGSEATERACDWSDFRKDYGISADPQVNLKEHRAFTAGWDAALRYAKRAR